MSAETPGTVGVPFSFYARHGKRALDLGLSGFALMVLSPLFVIVSLLVKSTSRGPVFFLQERAGLRGVPFRMIKFRSMRTFEDSYDSHGEELSNDQRVTLVGGVLRRSSLDELPQLVNVLIGDMSLVGPRPALMYQVERYDESQQRRLALRPGMTGLAQVSGRNSLSWEEKIELDVAYVQEVSLLLDLRILARTVRVVVSGAGLRFEKYDQLSEHNGELRRHIGERGHPE